MSNYTQPQFHLYRNKPTEEPVKLLQSDSATVIYKSMVVLESRKMVSEETFSVLNELSKNGKTFKNRKMGEWFALDETDIEQIKQNIFPKEIQILIPDKMPHIHTVQ